ncbi:aldehyde dehydrogenase [Streptomyces flaveus]|uniref:aldehyde dehydrogenase n=1 Tax=Streptomyces flaveus TaxID=66370 RepID=UPI003329E01C
MAHQYDRILIGGRLTAPSTDRVAQVVSPSTEEVIGHVPLASTADIDAAVAAARQAFDAGPWPRWSVQQRAAALRDLADRLDTRAAELAGLAMAETGCPRGFAEGYFAIAPSNYLRFYAELAEGYVFEEERVNGPTRTLVVREPVGVVVAIPAWNGPLPLTTQKIAAALMAGCTVIVKVPVQDPLACHVFAEAVAESAVPEGVISVFAADAVESEYVVAHPGVDKVSFTGSTAVGSRIAEACGRDIRRVTLELGGKSAAIVLDDADIDAVVPALVGCGAAFMQGEICTAQTRILLPRLRYAEFTDALARHMSSLPIGDPADPATVIGPMITEAHRARVEEYIALGRKEGATVACGGGRPAGLATGWYLEPTLFTDVTNDMRIAQEEIFGPVVVAIPHDGPDHAVELANDSPYGLSGTVWTQDEEAALHIARRVRTGTFSINSYTLDINAPFGGSKKSGIGRENGHEGLDDYLEPKAIALSGAPLTD